MGYDQWISVTNQNTSPDVIKVQNVALVTGKFYLSDKDNGIPASDIEGHEIALNETFIVSSCGPLNSPDGTEGSYDIVEKSTGDLVCTVYWNCPGGDKPNQLKVTGHSKNWLTETEGTDAPGPIGDVSLILKKF